MAFQLSPGVLVVEKDLTNVVPAVATSIGGFAGDFQWGPALSPVTISSEIELVKTFGKPNDTTAASFFSAANFLSYSNNLKVVRAVGSAARNAVESGTAVLINNEDDWEAQYANGAGSVGYFAAKFPGALGNSLKVSMADDSAGAFAGWTYADEFDYTPGTSDFVSALGGSNDELHLIVIDEDGLISGTPGTILEKFTGLSKASDAKTPQGAANYWKTVLQGSQYIWWMDNPAGTNWGSAAAGTTFDGLGTHTVSLTGGVSASPSDGEVITAFDELANAELIDVNLLVVGPHNATVASSVISIAEDRKDCMAFVSPELADVYNNAGDEADDIVAFRNTLTSSSYAVLDSGWKYQYDKYNDVYRWVPLNADIAGLCARTDNIADPWFSPGGLNRGQIRNVVKLAYSPNKTDRDTLYKAGVNPVVSFPGEGTVLFGDKTLLAKPSAFDRINVRRLFIVLEKAIALAAKYQLFEFNDAFTRAQFRNLVEPFLRDVRGRRGIYDFRVICDETNNTGEIIDRNEFVADIFIKPARSINYITLNFIATRTGVAFEEVAGA
jgi:phage tail sheath protein FI